MISNESYLSDVLVMIRPEVVLEIGTLFGCSAALFSQYAKKVISIDIASAPPLNRQKAEKVWGFLGIRERVRSYVISSQDEKKDIISSLKFDMAFIDGGHRYCDVEYDFNCVKHCGIVLFHDYKPVGIEYGDCNNKRYDGIVRFVDSLDPPAYIWGPHCSKFALWIEELHVLRSKKEFSKWTINTVHSLKTK